MIFIRVLHLPLEVVNNSRKCHSIKISNDTRCGRALPNVAVNSPNEKRVQEIMYIRRLSDVFAEIIARIRDIYIRIISVILNVDGAAVRIRGYCRSGLG
jgi:hypothetical protein